MEDKGTQNWRHIQDLTVKQMKMGILSIGKVDPKVMNIIHRNLIEIFPRSTCTLIPGSLPLPEETYNEQRGQYSSSQILARIRRYSKSEKALDRILGVMEIDIFVPNLNFVFGQAECPGKAALISLYRLRPEFYRQPPNDQLFMARSIKEAVHELGHTLGLKHCSNLYCVMHFSNSILETDKKRSRFCDKCFFEFKEVIDSLM